MNAVYAVTCLATDRVYVGATAAQRDRLETHRHQLAFGNHPLAMMQADWNEYGAAAFSFDVLERADTLAALKTAEHRWIARLVADGRVLYNRQLVSNFPLDRPVYPPTIYPAWTCEACGVVFHAKRRRRTCSPPCCTVVLTLIRQKRATARAQIAPAQSPPTL